MQQTVLRASPSLVLTAILCYLFENKRFEGPPIGDMIKKRQAAILAAEKAIGEIT